MATLQKSFFDNNKKVQKGKAPQWHKFQNYNNANRSTEQSARPPVSKAPIAASSQSRSKLGAFQLDMETPSRAERQMTEDAEARMENDPSWCSRSIAVAPQLVPHAQSLSQNSAEKDLRECPQTPVGRLPLAELIASGEDLNRQSLNLPPIERVLWNHSPHSSDPASSMAAALRKSHERAHSSSPASSSQNEVTNHSAATKPSLDLQTLQKCLKTPQADPANDLWSRYSLPIERRSPTEKVGPSFDLLMDPSSPQTPASNSQNRDSGGLRRSISCNMEWPTSAAKRRRIEYRSVQRGSDVDFAATEGANVGYEKSKISRVSLLVNKLHDGLARSRHSAEDAGPSSSSPLPTKRAFAIETSTSALQYSQVVAENDVRSSSQDVVEDGGNVLQQLSQQAVHTTLEKSPSSRSDCSSDFGDDEIDFEVFRNIDTSLISKSPAAPLDKVQSLPQHQQQSPSKPSQEVAVAIYDEFGDDDNDVSSADLESAVAQYDIQPGKHTVERCKPALQEGGPVKSQFASSRVDDAFQRSGTAYSVGETARIDLSSDDEFGGDLDFEQIVAECAEATNGAQVTLQAQYSHNRKSSTIQRYLIMTVVEGKYETSIGPQPEKVLLVEDEKTKQGKAITLRQSWYDSPYSPGSYVHVIGDFDRAGQCIVDERQNMIILHPDHLISATVVSDSFTCARRAVLQDRVKATSESNEPQVYGHILHEIFQEAMKANRWDTEWLAMIIENVASRFLETLFEINIELVGAVNHLKSKVVELQSWAEMFVAAKPKTNAVVKDRNGLQATMSVNKLLEVEEKVWSPMYGLKGNVDATVQVSLKDGNDEKILTVPFELKTGRHANASHKAQTALYTLLLSDRYDINIACGILYYTETSEVSRIPAIRHELIHMVIQRNKLASYVRQRLEFPPMIKSAHLCNKCYAQTPCFIYHKLMDDGNGETSGMHEKFNELVKHLTLTDKNFFVKWDGLLTKEEKDIVKFRRELWTMQSSEREKLGRCFGNVIVELGSFEELKDAPKINRYRYTFVKQKELPGFSFSESQIITGEPIVISDEKGHFALANGYVTSVRKRKIQVVIDRQLRSARTRGKNFDESRNQVFTGIMEVLVDGATAIPTQPQEEQKVLYRLDKDEFSNGMAMVRNNLIRLMEKDVFGAQALRRLIIEGVAPLFKPTPTAYTVASQASLNVDQKNAIEKVMSAKDYALVLGMPGTGKTTTIAHIIRALAAQGKSILLTSYTHTAVDNILLKIRNDGIGIFRLGAVAKVHPEVHEFADLAGTPMKTVDDIERAYSRQIVATTCLGINHPIFSQRIFDYCIVDEASQITLPVCLGPIRMARTFVLVGDHYQLPPLVQNKEAQEGGLDISLFKYLSDAHPSSVVTLEHQYRMCADIMTLSNTLIYNDRLKCGNATVAALSLSIPNISALKDHHLQNPLSLLSQKPHKPINICAAPTPSSCWLRDLLSPSLKACFLNTDPLLPTSLETLSNNRLTNPLEANLVTQLVTALLTTGVPASEIGIITLYRSQLALLKSLLASHPQSSALEMHTADKFQGRDKEVVVLSMVRSNDRKEVGMLLEDWRRVNVALTRARTKLVVVGSKTTLEGNPLLKKFTHLMAQRGWRYDLKRGAAEGHVWDQGHALSGQGSGEVVVERGVGKEEGAKTTIKGKKGPKRSPPKKVAKLDARRLLGSRPVLRDIVNDAF